MASTIYRQKLLHAILYFVKNTRNLNLTKLLKLLYFLDFTHFRETGYPSIGLKYYTFPRGPVPRDFWLEIRDGRIPADFQDKLAALPLADELAPAYREIQFRAKANPDLSVFTPREMSIMRKLADIYRDAKAWQMSEITHLPKRPWDITMRQGGQNVLIDYLLALDEGSDLDPSEAAESLQEHFEVASNFHIDPT